MANICAAQAFFVPESLASGVYCCGTHLMNHIRSEHLRFLAHVFLKILANKMWQQENPFKLFTCFTTPCKNHFVQVALNVELNKETIKKFTRSN